MCKPCKPFSLREQVLEPLVAKAAALDACNTLCAWLKSRQADLFLPL